ncbi:Thioesterase/thiol ester dehydrase-isomerase [Macrolepiota fuliginosa MF-IS2]|uniref:Thioesterase/thiol ester dehydrase-isomerase n=1 Tax=Macrolepiota fuliginosa MF-IS2 TaxID=1400762 RepID=A0A9P6C3D6_9AGAR|nr:Thioesterase/thiol ester dehydrase-isomerase [Macrolepiota fuliginosa MF-IS2]
MAACLRFTRRVWKNFLDTKGHDAQCFPQLQIHNATPGYVETSLKVEQYNTNRVGTVHGGLVLSLTDTLGSLAVATKGQFMTGVSTDIGTSFVRPAGRVGDVLYTKTTLTGMGKQLAYTRTDFLDAKGQLVAYGYHTKYIGKSSVHANNVTLSEDGERVLEGEDLD